MKLNTYDGSSVLGMEVCKRKRGRQKEREREEEVGQDGGADSTAKKSVFERKDLCT